MEDDWIELGELLRATGITKRTLARWRDAGLIPRPRPRPRRGGGTISKYPPGTLAQLRRVQELELEGPRRSDAWKLALWTEGYTVDIQPAVMRLLDNASKALTNEETVTKAFSVKNLRGRRGEQQRLLNRMTARVRSENWSEIGRWIFAVATGKTPAVFLRDHGTAPSPLSALLKIAGLPRDWGPPADSLPVERWSVAFLRDVTATMQISEMARVRLVFVRVARLAAAVDTVSLGTLPRHARRTLAARGVKVTQDTIALFRDLWSDIDIRLMLVPGFALILRGAAETAESWLSLAEAAVVMLPKRTATPAPARLAS